MEAQTLPDPAFTQVPCYMVPGIVDTARINPVNGASGYTWSVVNPANGITFNGQPGPYQSTVPEVAISTILPLPFYIICVTATSPCCTSATVCDTMWMSQIQFDQTNSYTASPGTSLQYGVNSSCNQTTSTWEYFWSVTGDIGINGTGATSASTPGGIPFINLDFGPNFTTGELCIWAITNFGIPTDTICMTISAPVGIPSINQESLSLFFDNFYNEIVFSAEEVPSGKVEIKIIDPKGSLILRKFYPYLIQDIEYRIKVDDDLAGFFIVTFNGGTLTTSHKLVITRTSY